MENINDLFRQVTKTNSQIQEQYASLVQVHVQAFMRPVLEAREHLFESLKIFLEPLQRDLVAIQLEQINEFSLAYRRSLGDFSSCAARVLQEILQPLLDLKTLPDRTRKALLALAQHGWFMDLDMSIPGLLELQSALESGNVEEAESAISDYFRSRLSIIAKSLEEKHPHRAKAIRAAFTAHQRGEYELSIPVFLIQADGICKELIDVELFKKRHGKPVTATYVEKMEAETFRSVVLHPLVHCLPIFASISERGPEFCGLNRHQVLHGELSDYGNELNSLRAVSLLNYISHALGKEDKEP